MVGLGTVVGAWMGVAGICDVAAKDGTMVGVRVGAGAAGVGVCTED